MDPTPPIDHLPHTATELARGGVGLFLGGAISVISGLLIYLLDAPVLFLVMLATTFSLGILLALGVPVWYWLVKPLRR